jgi:hypothetical protein
MKPAQRFALVLMMLLLTGCTSSSSIGTVNGKMSCSFKNQSLKSVCDTFTKSFAPLKGYTAEIPSDLKDLKVSFSLSDVTTTDPVREKLEEVTKYKVEIDTAKKVIRFVKK